MRLIRDLELRALCDLLFKKEFKQKIAKDTKKDRCAKLNTGISFFDTFDIFDFFKPAASLTPIILCLRLGKE